MAMEKKIQKIEDLEVYQKLCDLAIEIYRLSLGFPKFELYELGSQLRRSSNSAPANLAECFNNKHINIYLEGISRAQAEIREIQHHLKIAFRKKYLTQEILENFLLRYEECSKMLKGLEKSLQKYI